MEFSGVIWAMPKTDIEVMKRVKSCQLVSDITVVSAKSLHIPI